MTETRVDPWVPRCPPDVLVRAKRRGTTRVVGRVRTKSGERFFVSGMNDDYEVYIRQRPSCTCPDWWRPCKHLSYIFLDVLRVPFSSPIWWQTALLQSEIDAILPPRRTKRPSDSSDASASKKQRVDQDDEDTKEDEDEEDEVEDGDEEDGDDEDKGSDSEEDGPENEKGKDDDDSDIEFIGIKHPITSSGVKLSTVRFLILAAIKRHPSSIKYVEALRPTLLDGLSDTALRLALVRIAQEHADVSAAIVQQRNEENKVILRFAADAVEAEKVIHSLDRLRESQKFDRSSEISNKTDEIILRIVEKVNMYSHPESRNNALQAIILIGEAMFNAKGEIHKALVGYGDGISEVANGLESIVAVMQQGEKAASLEKLRNFAKKMDGYGADQLLGLVKKIEKNIPRNTREIVATPRHDQ